jgi:hypothetical protein
MDKFLLHRNVNESYIWGLRRNALVVKLVDTPS